MIQSVKNPMHCFRVLAALFWIVSSAVLSLDPAVAVAVVDDASSPFLESSVSAPPNCKEWNADNRLECWLWQLHVEIPNESFEADWITVAIKDMVCTNFALRDLQSDYPAPHALELSVQSLQASCHGKYHASGGISGNVRAGVSAQSSTLQAIQVAVRVLPSTVYPLVRPDSFQTTSCQTHLKAKDIHFTGSMSARLIQAFSKTIGHYITQALQEQLCPLLNKQLDPLVTDYLHQLDDWMKPYLPKGTPTTSFISGNNGTNDEAIVVERVLPSRPTLRLSAGGTTRRERKLHLLGSTTEQDSLLEHGGEFTLNALPASNASVYSPLDWNIVHWALELFNKQLEEHLQRGWFFSPNNTQDFCPRKCHNMFRGLSGWFRSIVGPALTIPLPSYFHNISLPALPLHATATIGVPHISIRGLDQLALLQLLRPILVGNGGNDTQSALASHIVTTLPGLRMETPVDMNIHMRNATHALSEPFTVKINVTQLDTLLTTSLQVMDWDQISLLQVVNAVQRFVENPTPANIRSTLGCLIRTVQQVENLDWITSIVLDSITITRRTARLQNQSAFLEEDLDHVINTALELLLGEYTPLWTDLMQGLIRDPARRTLNSFLKDWIHRSSSVHTCPAVPVTKEPKWLNFSKFLILDHFNDFLNHQSTLQIMNQFLDCVGKVLEGHVAAHAAQSAAMSNVQSIGSLLEVVRVETKNWNAIEHVQLFQPTDDTTVESSIQWGSNSTVPQMQVTLRISAHQVSGIVNITLFAGLQAKLETQLDYNLNRLENLTVAHLLQQVECGMVPMAQLRFLPKVTAASLGPWVGLNISALLNNQSISYSTQAEGNETHHVAQMTDSAINWSVEWLRTLANKALEDWVVRSSDLCPGIVPNGNVPDNRIDPSDSAWYGFPIIWVFIVFLVLAQSGAAFMLQGSNARDEESEEPMSTPLLARPSDEDIMGPAPLENDVDDYARDMREMDRSLLNDIHEETIHEMQSPMTFGAAPFLSDEEREQQQLDELPLKPLLTTAAVPEAVRFAIPMLIVATTVLLFSSNVSVGASVDMSIRVGATPIHLPGLFEFSLGNTISELYGAGIYPLLFLVAVFSGIWPYAKLAWMFYLWNASYQDDHRREQRLLTLDALSKFSLVDTYVLVVMLVAFRFHLDLSEDLGLDVYVTPEFGFYAFLLATCLSLVIGHGMLYYHRRAQQYEDSQQVVELIELRSIFDHAFDVEDNGPRRPLSHFFQVIIFVACLSATVFLILGFSQESFAFEFGGLAGMALGDKNRTTYSLVSLGAAIPRSVEDPNDHGVLFLQIAYFFYAVVTPVACLIILMTLLLYPTTPKLQKRLLAAAEIANAWSAVEVFVLSIVAALFQISTFASFIIGDRCDLVNKITGTLIGGNVIPADDAVCFSVAASVESSCWYLVAGVLLNSFAVSLVLRIAHAAVHERAGHSHKDSLARQLFGLPIGVVFFGAGVIAEGEESQSEEAENEDQEAANAPDWRFWF